MVGAAKGIIWVSSSLGDLRRFPELVQKVMGFAPSRGWPKGRQGDMSAGSP